MVNRDGAAGVTHRSVAKEAGITTSLTTYYFSSLDDLLVAALTSVTEVYTDRVDQLTQQDGDKLSALAELIAESAGEGRDRCLAERELSTLAGRREALRPAAMQWRRSMTQLGETLSDDPQTVAAFVAATDGLCTAVLLGQTPPDVDHIRAVLERIIAD